MTVVLIIFLGAAAVLWLSVFGYLLALAAVALTRRAAGPRRATAPAIAIVVPTLNEERLVLSKLDDLRRTDWPWPLVTLAAFALPAGAALFASRTLAGDCQRSWQLGLAAARLTEITRRAP